MIFIKLDILYEFIEQLGKIWNKVFGENVEKLHTKVSQK